MSLRSQLKAGLSSGVMRAGQQVLERIGVRTTRSYGSENWSHEESYRGISPIAYFHRSRIHALQRIFAGLNLPDTGDLADFGCSNGYIASVVRARLLPADRWAIHGFDGNEALIEKAAERAIPAADFAYLNLNVAHPELVDQFDVVMCLETLEHVGDYHAATRTLVDACKPGGLVLISVPNEIGMRGLLKFKARKVLQKDPYPQFFRGQVTERAYERALWTGADIERFRQPAQQGWGEHLGFDIRRLEAFIEETFVATGVLRMEQTHRSALDFGRFYVLRKSI